MFRIIAKDQATELRVDYETKLKSGTLSLFFNGKEVLSIGPSGQMTRNYVPELARFGLKVNSKGYIATYNETSEGDKWNK